MIDHTVIWPEKNLEISVSSSDEEGDLQRDFSYYSEEELEPERAEQVDEFEEKYNENPAFRRFVLLLAIIQDAVKIGVVAVLTIASARIIGIGSADPNLLFWSLLMVAIAIFVADDLVARIWLSVIDTVAVYVSGLAALLMLILYYTAKRRGGNISTLITYATIQPTDKVFIEEFVKTGRKFNP